MYKRQEYDEYYAQLDAHLARDLVEVEKAADAFGLEFAQKHHDDRLHYFVGAGNQYGSTYSYAMCYWEEDVYKRQVQMGQLLPQKIQIVFHWLPRCRWGHHIAHAQQAGRIYLLQGLSQLPGGGAQVTLPWGKALQQNFMIQCLRSVRQTAQALHQPGPQRPPRCV